MTRPLLFCLLTCLTCLSAAELPTLSNPSLGLDQAGALGGWTVRGKHAGLQALAAKLPTGLDGALSLTVDGVESGHGQIIQRLHGIPANTRIRLSAWVRSEIQDGAYLQLKRYRGKQELDRTSSDKSGPGWQQLSIAVDSGDADMIEILLRWRQEERFQRGEVAFGGVTLSLDEGLGAIPGGGGAIALVGDSTVQVFEQDHKAGWGEALPGFVTRAISNHAAGGRSSKTFRAEGRWEPVLAEHPSLILLQFGHNDSHPAWRPESTDAETGFRDHLRGYVAEARDADIPIVLLTPPPRRVFTGEVLSPGLSPYAEATRAIAAELEVPLIDLYATAGAAMRALGPEGCEPLFCSLKDRSHFSEAGARWLAGLVATALRDQGGELAAMVADPAGWPEHGLPERAR